jgi:hypothetical protein
MKVVDIYGKIGVQHGSLCMGEKFGNGENMQRLENVCY